MSSNTLAFALRQRDLPPTAQLALIIIADACGEYFSLQLATEIIENKTSIPAVDAFLLVENFSRHGLLKKVEQPSPYGHDMYQVVVHS